MSSTTMNWAAMIRARTNQRARSAPPTALGAKLISVVSLVIDSLPVGWRRQPFCEHPAKAASGKPLVQFVLKTGPLAGSAGPAGYPPALRLRSRHAGHRHDAAHFG